MRATKGKNAKRAKGFFTLAAGFKQPYKIILDGNFIHTALAFRMEDLDKRLASLLVANAKKGVKMYVTPCILAELERIGPDFAETLAWAQQQLTVLTCHHKEAAQPDECIKSIIGEQNEEHYFVATQDKLLRSALGSVKGGATLFLSVNGIHITQPTETQKWLAGQPEVKALMQGVVENMMPNEQELQNPALGQLDSLRQPLNTSGKFKKKKKGNPNPLAVKQGKKDKEGKKKKRVGPKLRNALKAAAAAGGSGEAGGGGGAVGEGKGTGSGDRGVPLKSNGGVEREQLENMKKKKRKKQKKGKAKGAELEVSS